MRTFLACLAFVLFAGASSASTIVGCNPNSSPVPDRVRRVMDSVDPTKFRTMENVLIDPDLSLLRAGAPETGYGDDLVPRHYWKCSGTSPTYTGVVEMSTAEKALVDAPRPRDDRPTCNAASELRGEFWVIFRGAQDDLLSICIREAGGGFAWRDIALEP